MKTIYLPLFPKTWKTKLMKSFFLLEDYDLIDITKNKNKFLGYCLKSKDLKRNLLYFCDEETNQEFKPNFTLII